MRSWLGEVGRILKVLVFYCLLPLFLAPSCKPRSSNSSGVALVPPTNLAATAITVARIDLGWANVPADAAAVEIERSLNGGAFALIATVPFSQTAYSDTGLAGSNEYCYRLRSVNLTGQGAYTPLVCANTVVVSAVTTTGGPPSARMGHSMIYDPTGDRLIVFGGLTGAGVTDELWILDLATNIWSQIPVSGLWPSPRTSHSAILDTTYYRMIVFGGYDGTPGNENDELWSLDLGGLTWSVLATSGGNSPEMRRGHTAIFDALNQSMVIFGGEDVAFTYENVWTLTLPAPPTVMNPSDWIDITPAVPGPGPRSGHSSVYDPTGQRMIVFGGNDPFLSGTPSYADTWELSLPTSPGVPSWSALSVPGGPAARYGHSAVLNGSRMMVFGGLTGVANGEMWQLNLGATSSWNPVTLGVPAPPARLGQGAALRATSTTMLIFGGGTDPVTPAFADVWQFGL